MNKPFAVERKELYDKMLGSVKEMVSNRIGDSVYEIFKIYYGNPLLDYPHANQVPMKKERLCAIM